MARGKGKGGGGRKPAGQKKPALTHFLCLPLVTPESRPQLERSLKRFRDSVAIRDPAPAAQVTDEGVAQNSRPGTAVSDIHPKAIRPVGALHCTLGVMSLDKDQLDEAVEMLKTLDVASILAKADTNSPNGGQQIQEHDSGNVVSTLDIPISPPPLARGSASSPNPLTVTLKGLVSMHAPHKTSILYSAPLDLTDRLYPFCLAVQRLFAERELLVPDDRKLKLHATIVNTIYAKGRKKKPLGRAAARKAMVEGQAVPAEASVARGGAEGDEEGDGNKAEIYGKSSGHGPNADAPLKIDATALIEKYKDFVWAENVVLDRVAICEMGAKKIIDADGRIVGEEYTEVASVKLPTFET